MSQPNDHQLFAVILGTNEIASAVGIQLVRAGYRVVLPYDPDPPVIRRKMAFHDALYTATMQIDDVVATRVDDGVQVYQALRRPPHVMVTWLGLLDLLPVRHLDLLIDARLQKRRITPDLRSLARLTIGLGPGFAKDFNCDVAVETRPDKIGLVTNTRWTDAADGIASSLGNVGAERFVYSQFAGRWHTTADELLSAAQVYDCLGCTVRCGRCSADPRRAADALRAIWRGCGTDQTIRPAK